MRNSRFMSLAVGATGPRGGRRSTHSSPSRRIRKVRLELPVRNCISSIGPSAPGSLPRRYSRRRFTSKRSSSLISVYSGSGQACSVMAQYYPRLAILAVLFPFAQLAPRQRHTMHLVGAVDDSQRAAVAPETRDGGVVGNAHRAMDLDR